MSETDSKRARLRESRILLVDDEPTTLDVVEMFLRADGYKHVISTSDPAAVRDLINREQPDLVILNLMMPELDGFQILQRMRDRGELEYMPVVILTSSTDAGMKSRALELGACDFLAKPVDPSELKLRLRNVLGAQQYWVEGNPPYSRSREQKLEGHSVATGFEESMVPIVSRLHGTAPNVRAIVEKFVLRLQKKLAEMEKSHEDADMARLGELAHWLRGAAGTVGFDVFTRPAEELQALAADGKSVEVEERIRDLRDLCDRIHISEDDET